MGVNLKRERFSDWLESYGADGRADYVAKLEKHVGRKLDVDAWQVEDRDFPRLGSYTTYGIFVLCLQYVTRGDYGEDLEEEEDLEFEALREFRAKLKPGSVKVPYAVHFLESGDTDTLFIPVLFAKPFVYDERFVASLPGKRKTANGYRSPRRRTWPGSCIGSSPRSRMLAWRFRRKRAASICASMERK
jgi:hypothetical protein